MDKLPIKVIIAPLLFVVLSFNGHSGLANKHKDPPENGAASCLKTLFGSNANKQIYDSIDIYLASKPQNSDAGGVETDLRSAIDWLEEKASTRKFLCANVYAKASKQLKALEELNKNGAKCDSSSMEVIHKNDQATRHNAHMPTMMFKSERLVDKLVHEIFLKHARNCLPVHREKFNVAYKHLKQENKEFLERVEALASGYLMGKLHNITADLEGHPKWLTCEQSDLKTAIEMLYDAGGGFYLLGKYNPTPKVALDALKHLARDDPRAKLLGGTIDKRRGEIVVKAGNIERIFRKYIVEPCQYFVKSLEPIMKPAFYDSLMLDDEWEVKERVLENFDYFLSRSAYKLCFKVKQNPQKLLGGLLATIWHEKAIEINTMAD